jgi:hypothetical protein
MKRLSSYSTKDFVYVNENGKRVSVDEPSDEQKQILEELIGLSFNDDDPDYNVHALYHSAPSYEGDPYAYMEAMEKFAEEHPEVQSFGFDDDAFMTSYGFVIPHKSKYQHMGHTVIFATQTAPPYSLFLYPGHLKSLLRALTKGKEILESVPNDDVSSPRHYRKEELQTQLLNTL